MYPSFFSFNMSWVESNCAIFSITIFYLLLMWDIRGQFEPKTDLPLVTILS